MTPERRFLDSVIAAEQARYARRVLPLLREMAAIQRITYDEESARQTEAEIERVEKLIPPEAG